MAATVSRNKTLRDWPHLIREVRMSSIVPDQAEDVTHGGPAGKNPDYIDFMVLTPPTAMCSFVLVQDPDNNSASSGTARIKFVAESGGDLTGLVVNVHFHFYVSASGGIDASNATA